MDGEKKKRDRLIEQFDAHGFIPDYQATYRCRRSYRHYHGIEDKLSDPTVKEKSIAIVAAFQSFRVGLDYSLLTRLIAAALEAERKAGREEALSTDAMFQKGYRRGLEEAREWIKAEARDCGCWERILKDIDTAEQIRGKMK